MSLDDLLAEGRRLQRPCVVLSSEGAGQVAAVWQTRKGNPPDASGSRCWLTVDTRYIPDFDVTEARYLSVYTDESDLASGRVESVDRLPAGVPLYASVVEVLAPIDAVIAYGSAAIDPWLVRNRWPRGERYNNNFRDRPLVDQYERIWTEEYPLFSRDSGVHAFLGGWHLPHADDDWHELAPHQLLLTTVQDSEPWVEAWRCGRHDYRVIQRIT